MKNLEDIVFVDNLRIDSLLDIAVNKLCAMADRFDAKDYVDVYCILKISNFSLRELLSLAEKKCEVKGIGPILKSRLLQIPEAVENITLKVEITRQEIKGLFEKLIKEIIVKDIGEKNAQ